LYLFAGRLGNSFFSGVADKTPGACSMEALTRLVAESLARHGFDRPVDYRRLQWSRWFRCESPHSLLHVPSKSGVFALAEEIMTFSDSMDHVGTAALGRPAEQSSAATTTAADRRMLAVLQFGEDDDMAFVLDRMFSRENPMRSRLHSGRCFVRFVVIEDEAHRRSIATALNQWLVSSGEKATGIGAHFATSLELTPARVDGATRVAEVARVAVGDSPAKPAPRTAAPDPALDSGANTNIHCPSPFPSGF
jgi:hypothetical protein